MRPLVVHPCVLYSEENGEFLKIRYLTYSLWMNTRIVEQKRTDYLQSRH